jgi:hypothetical protein
MQNNTKLNTKIHKLITMYKSSLHDKCPKNKSKYDRASSVVAGPCAPSSSPLPPSFVQPSCGGEVREGVSWMAIASSGRRLGGGGVAKGAPQPDGPAPSPVAACGVADPNWTAPSG